MGGDGRVRGQRSGAQQAKEGQRGEVHAGVTHADPAAAEWGGSGGRAARHARAGFLRPSHPGVRAGVSCDGCGGRGDQAQVAGEAQWACGGGAGLGAAVAAEGRGVGRCHGVAQPGEVGFQEAQGIRQAAHCGVGDGREGKLCGGAAGGEKCFCFLVKLYSAVLTEFLEQGATEIATTTGDHGRTRILVGWGSRVYHARTAAAREACFCWGGRGVLYVPEKTAHGYELFCFFCCFDLLMERGMLLWD